MVEGSYILHGLGVEGLGLKAATGSRGGGYGVEGSYRV